MRMLVAKRSFVARDPGFGPVRITAGQSHIAEDHPIVKAHPQSFAPAAAGRYGSREAQRAGGTATMQTAPTQRTLTLRRRGTERWRLRYPSDRCRITGGLSATGLRLNGSARAEMLRVMDRTARLDNLEVGGVLLGTASPSLVQILHASGPGPNAIRAAHSFHHDRAYEADFATRHGDGKIVPVGSWHTHPISNGEAWVVPSPMDLSTWASDRDHCGVDRYLALLAYPDRSISDGWEFAAWILRPGLKQDRCERVRL
jgi:integrative and conjugative element protein (TIGR02256 family)